MNVFGKPGSRNNSKTTTVEACKKLPRRSLSGDVGKETWEGNPTSPLPKQSRKSFFGSYKSVKSYHCFPMFCHPFFGMFYFIGLRYCYFYSPLIACEQAFRGALVPGCPAARQSAPESLLVGYPMINPLVDNYMFKQ